MSSTNYRTISQQINNYQQLKCALVKQHLPTLFDNLGRPLDLTNLDQTSMEQQM